MPFATAARDHRIRSWAASPLLLPLIVALVGIVVLGAGIAAETNNARVRLESVTVTYVGVTDSSPVTATDRQLKKEIQRFSVQYVLHQLKPTPLRWTIDVVGHSATLRTGGMSIANSSQQRWAPPATDIVVLVGLALLPGAGFMGAWRWRPRTRLLDLTARDLSPPPVSHAREGSPDAGFRAPRSPL